MEASICTNNAEVATSAAPSVPKDSVATVVGLKPGEWASCVDSTTTLGDFVHTSLCKTDAQGRVVPSSVASTVPTDSVPAIIGLTASEWPSVYDSTSSLGGFVHTSYCTTNTEGRVMADKPAPIGPADSVPMSIGLKQSEWK